MESTAGAQAPVPAGKRPPKVGHSVKVYGKELTIVRDLGIGPTMAARVVGNTLYTIGRGKLHVADITDPADPKIVGKLFGLGNTRQIAVRRGIAYITSREDGVFIVDVATPEKPRLLCHYDPIEVATGVDVSGSVLFVACRSHGVELVDVSDPEKPLHLGTTRTGEAQSVAVLNGYAYVGVWGTSELVTVDVGKPREPKITARCRLDGFGDGVAVRGKYVYVATGHHSRARRASSPKEGDPGYGCGHGLEIYDISDPAKPEFVSRIKTPPFYRIGNDMWGVKLAGPHAFVHDTHNGVFVINVSNAKKPYFVAHRQLPYVAHPQPRYMGSAPLPSYVGGLALARDYIYVAGGWSDLHVVAAPGIGKPCTQEPDNAPVIPPFKPRQHKRFRIYRPDGQVRGVAFVDDVAVVAAGSDGIHLVQVWPRIKRLNRYDTKGFAMEVRAAGEHVYVAEEKGGLSIWKRSGPDALTLEGRYQPRGRIVRDVVVYPPGRYALVQVDLSILDILDVTDPARPKQVLQDKGHGFVYHIADDVIHDREVCVLWQMGGLRWYDLYTGPEPKRSTAPYPHRIGAGGTVPIGEARLVAYWGGLVLVERGESRPPGALTRHRLPGLMLGGRPLLVGSRLYLSSRTSGDITIVDVSDPEKPKLVEHLNVPGNPGRLVFHKAAMVIPNGYEGLWVER